MKLHDIKQAKPFVNIDNINKKPLNRLALNDIDFGEFAEHNIDSWAELTKDTGWKNMFPNFSAKGVGTVFLMFDSMGTAIRVGSSKSLNGRFATFKYGRGTALTQENEVRTWKETESAVIFYMKKPSTAKHLEKMLREQFAFKYNVKRAA
jgi:hypothetical protein